MGINDFSYTVKCNWVANEDKELSSAVSVGDAADPKQRSEEYDGEMIHVINDNHIVNLLKPEDNEESCSLTLLIDDLQWRVRKISVVSEAPIVELYGDHGEYISTSRGYQLNDSGTPLFNSQVDVYVRRELTLKFPGVISFLLYGIKILVETSTPPGATFDYTRVNDLLVNSKVPLSGNAEKAKLFFEKYSSMFAPKQSDSTPSQMLLESGYNMSELMKLTKDEKFGVSDRVLDLIRSKEKTKSETAGASELKSYIDESVKQLEERVQNNLTLQLQEMETKQNEKLDTILKLLSNKS